jgi:signal transduction histidine kinase
MLSITPVVARPINVVANTVKMFDGEIALHRTKIEIVRDVSYSKLHVDYVLCDTSRLMQVLINLISNAIKFTGTRLERKISVEYGAQQRRPPSIRTVFGDLNWMALRYEQSVNSALPDLQNGEAPLYLYFCVQDTGPGVTPSEMNRLFQRFSQANSRTHIAYGGSGLGLYICRELAEKQGGGVGAASRPNEGSVFGFYIETRHAKALEQAKDAPSRAPARPTTLSIDRPDLPQRLTSRNAIPKANGELDKASPAPELAVSQQKTQGEGYHVLLVEGTF